MVRIFLISLTASLVALWAVIAKAESWHGQQHSHPNSINHTHQFAYPPANVWPNTNHEPAIGKSLTPSHPFPVPNKPMADYQYEWQRQPASTAPRLAVPQQFAHPQRGYFPREGKIEQAPGYEYDFGDTGTYPPLTPLEGATWVGPRRANVKPGLHAPQPFTYGSGFETHIGCLHW